MCNEIVNAQVISVGFNAADSKVIFVWWPAAQKWLQDQDLTQVKYDQKKLLCMVGIVVFL